MSTYDDASLITYPSGYKSGVIYSQKPTDGSGDLTFTRASTATRTNESGLIESVASGVPRIDYTGGGCGKFLLEPQRTNLLLRSEEFDNVYWSKTSNGTGVIPIVTANAGVAPDGNMTADRVQFDLSGGLSISDSSLVSRSVTVTNGATTAKSIYIKSFDGTSYDLVLYETTSAIGTNVKKITITNDWQRFDVFGSVGATTSGVSFGLRNINVSGLSDNADVLVWGGQLEEGSYPTTYIPTVSATATRLKDASSTTGLSSVINSIEGVIYAEISAFDETSRISINDGTTNNNARLTYNASTNEIGAVLFDGVNQAILDYVLPIVGGFNKLAFKYKENDFALWVNGVEVDSQVGSGTTFTIGTLSDFSFDAGNNSANFYGECQSLMLFPTALSDTELATLTTI